jgi:uncharacterized protein (TIGR02001 family)
MARRNREVGFVKSCVLASALIAGLVLPAQADDKRLNLSATTYIATDYMFRGYSSTNENPEAVAEFDLTYGIFYAGIWASNTAFGDGVETDPYIGIAPKWGNVAFNFGFLPYIYPGASEANYIELKAAAAYTSGNWTFGIGEWWSPDNFQLYGNSFATEGSIAYAFQGKLFNFFTPTVSGLFGYQTFEDIAPDYAYWNAGLTLGFWEHYSFDVRYWDTDVSSGADCIILSFERGGCDARAVGTLKAVF